MKTGEKTPTRPRVTLLSVKIVMTVFLDCEGVLLVDFLAHGTKINDPYYASLLYQLRSSIRKKLRCGVLLLHNNAPIYKSIITQVAIQYTNFTELNHPTYSPDLTAGNYHLFSNLKNLLRGRNFESDNDHESIFVESLF